MKELFNFSKIDDAERALMEERKIDFNKLHSQLAGKSRKDAKPKKCLCCNTNNYKFCNSHSLPASFLRNIEDNGKIYTTSKLIDIPLLEPEKGVKETGTFNIICRDCDNKVFKEYENPENYKTKPTDKMIAQIAMKNHLRNIGKRRFEISLYKNILKETSKKSVINPFIKSYYNENIEVSNIDLNEYIKGFKKAKKVIEKDWDNEYYLFFYEKLNYTIPIAYQGELSLNFDFLGNTINDVYNRSKKYKIQTVHISIFPLKSESIIMMFIDKNDRRYRAFYKQFSKLELNEKLSAINFIIFSLAEDVFMSKHLHKAYTNDENLKNVAGLTAMQFSDAATDINPLLKNSFDLSKMNEIPNFLLMDINNGNAVSRINP